MDKGNLKPYEFQVGGHHTITDTAPVSLKDDNGRFYKKLQSGERSAREVTFYQAIEQHRQLNSEMDNASDSAPHSHSKYPSQKQYAVMQELAKWVPKSYGVVQVSGADYLVLQDLAAEYQQPCVMDIKVGYRTWYPWASPDQQQKYRQKDESTTQCSLGFRVCGMLVHDSSTGNTWRGDRHWGKTLNDNNVHEAFHKFASNGYLDLTSLLLGPGMLLEQLQQLSDLFKRQQCWHFYSASLLVVYEGTAQTAAESRLAVRLIDFAHAFPVAVRSHPAGEDAQLDSGPSGIDQNFLDGLNSLALLLQKQFSSTTLN